MEIQNYTYLKIVHFQDMQEWSAQFLLNSLIKYKDSDELLSKLEEKLNAIRFSS